MSSLGAGPAPGPAEVRAFRIALPAWYGRHRRALPWRVRRTPYRVWISELMLQQTRVDQALPYFQRWMRQFPSLAALARAPRGAVLKAWEGLGYYSRARRAHDTAKLLCAECGGRFPRTIEGLRALPGVGPYTAAAIGSLAFGLPATVVDGNVLRVLARVTACSEPVNGARVRARFQQLADALMPPARAAVFNEAMMELGALVCLPRKPDCLACPLKKICRALLEGDPTRYPVAAPRAAVPHKQVGAGLVVDPAGRVLIAQRREGDMLGGLWEFPGGKQEPGETMPACIARELREELGIEVDVGELAVTVRHAFSHFTMDLHAYWARRTGGEPKPIGCADCRWVFPAELPRYAFGRADQRIIERVDRLQPARLP